MTMEPDDQVREARQEDQLRALVVSDARTKRGLRTIRIQILLVAVAALIGGWVIISVIDVRDARQQHVNMLFHDQACSVLEYINPTLGGTYLQNLRHIYPDCPPYKPHSSQVAPKPSTGATPTPTPSKPIPSVSTKLEPTTVHAPPVTKTLRATVTKTASRTKSNNPPSPSPDGGLLGLCEELALLGLLPSSDVVC